MNISLSFISDDGFKIDEGMEVFVQDKEGGYFEKKTVNYHLLKRRLGMVEEHDAWMYPDEVPIYWNYFLEEENAIEKQKHIELNGPDKKYFLPKTIIRK